MTRLSRQASDSGIYHVMMRGVNRQDIFECPKDYIKFLELISRETSPKDEEGKPLTPNLCVYAYCLMPNHVHLLVKETANRVSDPIKSIAISYAYYFNVKYEHIGHLFQDRFRSEVVNDMEYFITLLRYIHQNPVAGGLVSKVSDYKWSSWCEFDARLVCAIPVCATDAVLKKISFDTLQELVNDPLPKTKLILDIDRHPGARNNDGLLRDFIRLDLGIKNASNIQQMTGEDRDRLIRSMYEYCHNINQISRVTGISYGVIRRQIRDGSLFVVDAALQE